VTQRRAHSLGWEPQPGLARLHLMTGRPALAVRGLERALEEGDWTQRERRGELLCLLVRAAAAAGDVERARDALRTAATDPQMLCTEALRAQYCAAEAEIAIAEGGHGIATRQLRQSVRHWREVGSRTGEVEARLRLAECLLADDDASAAELELHAIEANLAAAAPYRERIAELRRALAAQPAAGEKR